MFGQYNYSLENTKLYLECGARFFCVCVLLKQFITPTVSCKLYSGE